MEEIDQYTQTMPPRSLVRRCVYVCRLVGVDPGGVSSVHICSLVLHLFLTPTFLILTIFHVTGMFVCLG